MSEKKKILTISDHILTPSGVGHVARNFIFALLKTGNYKVISLGGGLKHNDYRPQRLNEFGEDLTIIPVDGYGTQDLLRSIIRAEKPDLLWMITDPRFYPWLWSIENEIRKYLPIVYHHVWDNFPPPHFNKSYYSSNDVIVTISKLTQKCVEEVTPEVKSLYLPHSVDDTVFRRYSDLEIEEFKRNSKFGKMNLGEQNKLIFFWNNRNARRKQSGSLLWWFNDFLNVVGRDKAMLIMHTDTHDIHGQDLEHIADHLGMVNGEVVFSKEKLPQEVLAKIYNIADCTINVADSEGFGISTLESLSCETPIIVNMTGGLQEQVTDGKQWFGYGIKPSSSPVIGSQEVPYILEDHISKEDFISTLTKFLNLSKEQRQEMGRNGRKHVLKNYNFNDWGKKWVEIIEETIKENSSWKNRKNYKTYELRKI